MDGDWTGAKTDIPEWVNRLTIVVLTLTLLYLIVGIPQFDRSGAPDLDTDAVDPIHRFGSLALMAAAVPVGWACRRRMLAVLRSAWPLLLLYAYFAASVGWALDPAVSLRRFMLAALQLVQVAALLSGLRRAATLHVLIALACVLGAAADAATYAVAPGFAMADDGFVGLQLQKNGTGQIMMYGCLAASTAWFLLTGKWLRRAIVASVLMMAGLLVATRSTTSQSVVIMSPFVVPLIMGVAKLRRAAMVAVAVGVVTTLVGAAFFYLAWCGMLGRDPWAPTAGMTFTMRTDIWSFVLGEIGKRPWLGAGYNSFWAINPAIQPSLKSDDWFGTFAIINEAHNGYLDLLAMGGYVGLALGLLAVFRTIGLAGLALARAEPAAVAWRTGRLAYPTAAFHMALLVGLLVHNFTESNLFSANTALVVAFLLAALDLEKWRLLTRQPSGPRYPIPAGPRRRRADVTGATEPTGSAPSAPAGLPAQ